MCHLELEVLYLDNNLVIFQADLFPKDDGLYEKRKQIQAEVDEAKRKLGQQVSELFLNI